MPTRRRLAAAAALAPFSALASAVADAGGDPLGSAQWPGLREAFIGADPVQFSPQVRVLAPATAEDALNVPVMVDARALRAGGAVLRRIRVVVDRNPIRHVLDYQPMRALPVLAFRLRLEQASPVRALVQATDGRWHVGGTWVQAAGGGCTVAGASRNDGSWSRTLNQVQARFFDNALDGSKRLRLRVMHPMDTGLVAGIPAFHLESLSLRDADGTPWWQLALREPVAENPLLSFELPRRLSGRLLLAGQDNNGHRFEQVLVA